MPIAYPRLRCDLIISRQETGRGLVFVIKDPRIGRFVRFREREYFIAQQLDGFTSPHEICRRGQEQFGAPLTESTLEGFAAKLGRLGLLDNREAPEPEVPRQAPPRRMRGNILSLRLTVLDPDPFLAAMVPRLWFIFTPWFACFSIGVILSAAMIMTVQWDDLHRRLAGLYRLESIPLAWLTLFCIVIGHEFSHGLTCKRFGGSVHEIGLLLIYLQPAMYCNVSEAWMFPEKRKRLLVTLAGAWFEIFAWAWATIAWRITEPGTMPNYVALLVATTLGIKTLFNLNPLIKLDGYYLLSDWLEIPNLRKNAFRHIATTIKRLWRWDAPAARATGRERRIFWLYGLLAGTYSVWLLGLILLTLGSFLVARYQGWGLVLFMTTLGIIFRHPLRLTLRSLGSQLSPVRGILRVMRRLFIMVVILGSLGAGLYYIQTEFRVSGEFRILPLHNAEVRAEVEGIIEEIAPDEGDVVAAGDLIARLSDRDHRAELEKVKSQIAEQGARLKMLKAGARAEEIELARTTVTKEEERVKYAQFYLDMERKLYNEKLSSKKDFELAEETATLRQEELEESKGTLKLLLAGSRPEQIEATEAELSRLTWQRSYLEEELKRLRILSPINGIVTTHRLKERTGATVRKGDVVAEVQELKAVTAEISIPEQEVSQIKIGQEVLLKARAHVDKSFRGKVVAISPVASKPIEGIPQRNFIVTTQLANPDLLLKGDMSGNAKISCGVRRLYEIVFRRFIRFVRVEFWSWW
jgi:multidrug resistance efflux pump